jgi:glycosyltransferase involved in cell wall biosynthesis
VATRDSSQPRVLLACDWFVKYTAGLAGGLAELGCDVTLLTRDHDLEFGGEAGARREFLRAALGDSASRLELSGKVRDARHLAGAIRLRRAIGRRPPEVVHVQDSLANDIGLALAARLRTDRYALTVHDPVPHPGDAVPAHGVRSLRRLLRRRAGLVFVHSEALAGELSRTGEVTAPIEVVPHGTDVAAMEPLPASCSLLFFGRISHYKGLDVLLDAMPLVWEVRPEVTLTVAGEGPLLGHRVLSDTRVAVHAGHVPESKVAGLFADSTMVVLPYRQASQSGVGSLARQHGRAVIASAVGGLPELIASDWGRLVPSEDPQALAATILEIVETPGLASEMGRNAAASIAEADWRSVAAKTLEAYRRYLS